ncbi:Sec-independent protein translocase subunit TatB [Enterobacteriaceae bacterium EKM102V]|uniref:Sec-independent protein translocase protein TatB n=1 Tax=Pantoea TaxID=53335 RepID=UPI00142D38F0|nr:MULTISPECIES: Sec-independent protein translocase protein TatB [Pantoea]KAF6658592.1 Sec-independent protein translocase subunit TatB [Enterobacteriaceae bacterium EKM102V]KAF6667204.1 Sec-independent protein translocase subunit TatB [Pantoea sp. EKM103V]
MFDIGFSELVLVFVIGLIVLGPQRLPVAVKTVVGWIRAIRSLAANVQHELAQELKLQELQESLKKVEEAGRGTLSPELKESMEELRKTADSMKRSVSQSIDIEKEEDEANTIHSAQHRYAPEPAATETAATPASAEHQSSAPAQAPSAAAGADAAVQPAPAAAAQRTSAAPSSAAPAAVASTPAQAPAGESARLSESARPSATSSSAGDER